MAAPGILAAVEVGKRRIAGHFQASSAFANIASPFIFNSI
jgi:hypothetical protein